MSEPGCPMCQKLAHPEQGKGDEVVWRFPNSVAMLGRWQGYAGYCVLAANVHARELFDLPDDGRRAYFDEMCLLARAIQKAFSPHKLNYELLGNQVPHLHWHVFPRYQGDPDLLSPVWKAIDAAEQDAGKKTTLETGPDPRERTVARIQEALAALGAPNA
jgi:diadenosine tetraphosphate (Ap4A) HIT family hydrolase